MNDKEIDFSSTEIPWPQKGDVLFDSGDDWWNNACLNYASDDWELYIGGYKKAADILAKHIDETKRNQDFLVFPLVFLYRQYLELRLKKLVIGCKMLFDEPPEFPKNHDLRRIWNECKVLIERVEPKSEIEDLEAVDEIIAQFCNVDPGSFSFRYPTNKKDEKSIPKDLKYINLRNLSEVMNRISSFFEAGEMMVSVYLDNKQEMDQAFGDFF